MREQIQCFIIHFFYSIGFWIFFCWKEIHIFSNGSFLHILLMCQVMNAEDNEVGSSLKW